MSELSNLAKALYQAINYPIYECLINSGWEDLGHARIVISRKMPNNNLVFGAYMVDIFCLGIKETFCNADFHQLKYETELKSQLYFDETIVKCEPNLAYNIIYGGINYAEKLGFLPEKDFKLSRLILEPEQDIELVHNIRFGYEGRPFFIRGPYDDTNRIIKTLRKTVGDGKFDVLCDENGDILNDIDDMIDAGYLTPEKIGRNEPCLCGSGKKYKKCCGLKI